MIEFILERPIEEALELPTYVFKLDHILVVRGESLPSVPSFCGTLFSLQVDLCFMGR